MNSTSSSHEKYLLLMQPAFLQGVATSPVSLPTHDWGFFGEYEYLGPGTPYALKREAGIIPRNELDRLAQYHDQQYDWTNSNALRAVVDQGAGAAMVTAAFNPWNDLSMKDRVLAFVAGDALLIQGTLRWLIY